MNIFPIAQARFPAPEFDNYTLPTLELEQPCVDGAMALRLAVLALFLAATALAFYKYRSRKALVVFSMLGLLVFGFAFTACPCPAGMHHNIVSCAFGGAYPGVAAFLLFALPLAFALFYGRIFCAGACPLGAVQELLHWKSLHIPRALDRVLRLIPVAILLASSILAASGMGFASCRLDPYMPVFLKLYSLPLFIIALAFVLVGLFVSRPYCRYFCPYGALMRLFAHFTWKQPRITAETCIDCRLCEQGCPNGAIMLPERETPAAEHAKALRRLGMLIAFFPFALAAGGFFGAMAAPIVSRYHPDAVLLKELEAGRPAESLEAQAFQLSGRTMEDLRQGAMQAKNRILILTAIAGALLAGCAMLELINGERRRDECKAYTIDAGLCVCCGRCFLACPLNSRKGGNAT